MAGCLVNNEVEGNWKEAEVR